VVTENDPQVRIESKLRFRVAAPILEVKQALADDGDPLPGSPGSSSSRHEHRACARACGSGHAQRAEWISVTFPVKTIELGDLAVGESRDGFFQADFGAGIPGGSEGRILLQLGAKDAIWGVNEASYPVGLFDGFETGDFSATPGRWAIRAIRGPGRSARTWLSTATFRPPPGNSRTQRAPRCRFLSLLRMTAGSRSIGRCQARMARTSCISALTTPRLTNGAARRTGEGFFSRGRR